MLHLPAPPALGAAKLFMGKLAQIVVGPAGSGKVRVLQKDEYIQNCIDALGHWDIGTLGYLGTEAINQTNQWLEWNTTDTAWNTCVISPGVMHARLFVQMCCAQNTPQCICAQDSLVVFIPRACISSDPTEQLLQSNQGFMSVETENRTHY